MSASTVPPFILSGPCSDSDFKTNQDDTSTLSMGPFTAVGDDNNSLLFFELLDLTGVGELPPDNELMPLSDAPVPPLPPTSPPPRNGELLRVAGKLLAVNVLRECE